MNSSVIWVFVTRLMLILFLRCEGLVNKVLFVPQAMRLQQADLWYRSSFDRSRSVETSQSSSLSSQHSLLESSPQPSPGFPLWGICLRPKWLQLYCTCICTLNDIYKQKWSVISSKVYKQRLFKHPDMVTWCEAAIEKNPQSFFLFNSSLFTIRESCCHQLISLMWDLIPLIPFLSFTYMLLHCKEWIKSKMSEWLKRRESLQH